MPTFLTRRHVLALAGGTVAAMVTGHLAPALAQPVSDVAFVRQLSDKLIGIINGPGSLADKRQRILPLIDENVDVSGIGRFCLGRYWRTATPEQQQHFLDLFHRVLMHSITDKLGDYQGVRIEVGASEARGNGHSAVSSVITRPSQPPLNVQWVITHVDGAPKIADVIGEGVSMSITERGDYTSYLQRNGNNIDALLKALERQAAHQA